MKKVIKLILLIMTAAVLLTACGSAKNSSKNNSASLEELMKNTDNITITLTTGDVIKAELYPDVAPITVANFEELVEEKFYDGLIFHRVISDFMIQGGGYTEQDEVRQSDAIKGEFSSNGVQNDLKHTRGVLSMARTSDPDSASNQFFIVQKDSSHLDGEYAAFGKVTEGIEVVDKIAQTPTDSSDKPITPVVIQTITLDD